MDLGDIIGIKGIIFCINIGEFFVKVMEFILFFKLLCLFFDKYYGLKDVE